MDILGKQGEEASERLRKFEQRMEKLESHLDAVDSALQDFVDNYSHVLEQELEAHEDEILRLREVLDQSASEEESIQGMNDRIERIEMRLSQLEDNVEGIAGSDIEQSITDMAEGIKSSRKMMESFRSRITELEDRVDEIEHETMVEINKREYDFDQKLDSSRFEDENQELWEEVKKLRASVNFLADELDKRDEIEIE